MADTTVPFNLFMTSQIPPRTYSAGEVIFNESDPANELFVIQSGTVEIRRRNGLLDTLSEKNISGEMALIDGEPRSAKALAATPVALVPISEKQFLFLVSLPIT